MWQENDCPGRVFGLEFSLHVPVNDNFKLERLFVTYYSARMDQVKYVIIF